MTWLNLFFDGFNQKSRLIIKKTRKKRKRKKERKEERKKEGKKGKHEVVGKNKHQNLLMETRSRSGLICYEKVMTASQNVSSNQNAPFHRT